ncbi:MAG: thioredoxin family protein, partial [Halioglobus sp.]|nr:thioredoxin family protein [Halioglobus sp.]
MPAEDRPLKSSTRGFNPEYGEEAPTLDQVSELAQDAILEFGAPWCGHCKAAMPAMREALRAHPDITHIKVYDGKGKPLGRAFGVKQWPTVIRL